MAIYKFVLCYSHNLERIDELTLARDRSFQLTLNRAGSCSFSYPMDEDIAFAITPYATCVIVFRDNIPIWSGYVLTVDEDVSNNTMKVDCVGWLQRLEKRFIRQQKQYTNVDDADIIQDLLNEANLTASPAVDGSYPIPVPTDSDPYTPTWLEWGGAQPNEGAGGPTAYVPLSDPSMGGDSPFYALRTITYEKYQNILPLIQQMSGLENGCDIYVDPITRELTVYRKKMRDQLDVVFGYRWGPNNIQTLGRRIDGSTVVNYHVTSGRNTVTPQYADDVSSQMLYGVIEEQQNLADVGDANVLLTYSGEEVVIRKNPHITYTLVPFPYTPEKENVPEPFVDYNVGDKVYFKARHLPRVDISQAVRVFGMSVSISPEGNEILGTLELSPSGS